MTEYIVVQSAKSWEKHFLTDPKDGCNRIHSAHLSLTGMRIGLRTSYPKHETAQRACKKMNIEDPVGDYSVCLVKENVS